MTKLYLRIFSFQQINNQPKRALINLLIILKNNYQALNFSKKFKTVLEKTTCGSAWLLRKFSSQMRRQKQTSQMHKSMMNLNKIRMKTQMSKSQLKSNKNHRLIKLTLQQKKNFLKLSQPQNMQHSSNKASSTFQLKMSQTNAKSQKEKNLLALSIRISYNK